jgi:hypothetical protein
MRNIKKEKARLDVAIGIRFTHAEKLAVEKLAEREERAPSVVVPRLVLATLRAEGLL